MFKSITYLTFLMIFTFTTVNFTDAVAKSSSSRSSSSRSSSSRSSGSTIGFKKQQPLKKTVTTTRTTGSTLGKPATKSTSPTVTTTRTTGSKLGGATTTKPAATTAKSTSTVDKVLNKKVASGKRTYSSKAEATTAYKKSLGENKFTTQPSTRPSYIPEYRMYNGTRVNTVFYNGHYGYRRDGVFVVYDYDDYYYDDNDLGSFMTGVAIGAAVSGGTHHPRTVVQRETNSNDVKIVLIVIFALFAGVVVAVILYKKFSGGSNNG